MSRNMNWKASGRFRIIDNRAEDRRERRPEHRSETLAGIVPGKVVEDVVHGRAGDDGDDVLLAREVAEERSRRDVRCSRDVLHGGRPITPLDEELPGRLGNLAASSFLVPLRQASAHGPPCQLTSRVPKLRRNDSLCHHGVMRHWTRGSRWLLMGLLGGDTCGTTPG